MAFAKIHEAVHVCSLVGEQKYVQRFVALENAEMHCRKQRYAGQHNIRLRRLRRGPDVGANGLKMVIYDQVLSERLLQFNDVCRCQLVIADDVIIPYSSKKQICSIYRWEKRPTVSRYRLNAERQNDGVLTCHLYGF